MSLNLSSFAAEKMAVEQKKSLIISGILSIKTVFGNNSTANQQTLGNMIEVKSCPKNQTDYDEASKGLGCGNDLYGNKQYMCLPNVEKTALIEFCHDDIMGIHEKGYCLELNVSEGEIIPRSCFDFLSGCPKEKFWNQYIFKYPACQEINTEHHCYSSLPSCPPTATGLDSNVDDFSTYIIVIILVIATLISGAASIVIIRKKIHKRDFPDKENTNFMGQGKDAENGLTTPEDIPDKETTNLMGQGNDAANWMATSESDVLESYIPDKETTNLMGQGKDAANWMATSESDVLESCSQASSVDLILSSESEPVYPCSQASSVELFRKSSSPRTCSQASSVALSLNTESEESVSSCDSKDSVEDISEEQKNTQEMADK